MNAAKSKRLQKLKRANGEQKQLLVKALPNINVLKRVFGMGA